MHSINLSNSYKYYGIRNKSFIALPHQYAVNIRYYAVKNIILYMLKYYLM